MMRLLMITALCLPFCYSQGVFLPSIRLLDHGVRCNSTNIYQECRNGSDCVDFKGEERCMMPAKAVMCPPPQVQCSEGCCDGQCECDDEPGQSRAYCSCSSKKRLGEVCNPNSTTEKCGYEGYWEKDVECRQADEMMRCSKPIPLSECPAPGKVCVTLCCPLGKCHCNSKGTDCHCEQDPTVISWGGVCNPNSTNMVCPAFANCEPLENAMRCVGHQNCTAPEVRCSRKCCSGQCHCHTHGCVCRKRLMYGQQCDVHAHGRQCRSHLKCEWLGDRKRCNADNMEERYCKYDNKSIPCTGRCCFGICNCTGSPNCRCTEYRRLKLGDKCDPQSTEEVCGTSVYTLRGYLKRTECGTIGNETRCIVPMRAAGCMEYEEQCLCGCCPIKRPHGRFVSSNKDGELQNKRPVENDTDCYMPTPEAKLNFTSTGVPKEVHVRFGEKCDRKSADACGGGGPDGPFGCELIGNATTPRCFVRDNCTSSGRLCAAGCCYGGPCVCIENSCSCYN